jgi:Icc-related predicted phosphoesterase
MSDLHGELPDAHDTAEITLICGDIVPLRMQRNIPQSKKWLETEFAYWVKNWPSEKIYFIGGNHDFIFDGHYTTNDALQLKILTDEKLWYLNGYTVVDHCSNDGKFYKIYGTPFCHIFGNWAFMREDETLRELYCQMPNGCDIVISHDAADINNLGLVPPNVWHPDSSVNAGNKVLAEFIKLNKPKYYFCGHIHEGNHHVTEIDGTTMANVSLLDDSYQMVYEPLYLDI